LADRREGKLLRCSKLLASSWLIRYAADGMGSDRIKLGVKNAVACECDSQTAFATLAFARFLTLMSKKRQPSLSSSRKDEILN
jgi:hypothetical protein